MTCQHENFVATVNVARIDEGEGLLGLYADITVTCTDCDEPMLFRGPDVGLSQREPRVEVGRAELRCPLFWKDRPDLGIGLTGYDMTVH